MMRLLAFVLISAGLVALANEHLITSGSATILVVLALGFAIGLRRLVGLAVALLLAALAFGRRG